MTEARLEADTFMVSKGLRPVSEVTINGHMTSNSELRAKVEELEVDLGHRDEQIKELREERRRAVDLVDEMRDNIEDSNSLIDSWIEAFGLELGADGTYSWPKHRVEDQYSDLLEKHYQLIRKFNKFIGDYNRTVAPRNFGRPLEASEVQIKKVRQLRKAKDSLRAIAAETGLGLRTVRTIVDKDAGTGRIGKRTNLLRKREVDRLRAAEHRSRKKIRGQLSKRITETRKRGEALIKAAKGLDD